MSAENRRHILPVGRGGSYEVGDFYRDRVSLHAVDGITIAPVSAGEKLGEEPHDDF
jgi:predicted metalloprotease with PDZ domain